MSFDAAEQRGFNRRTKRIDLEGASMSTTETKVIHAHCATGDHCTDCFNAGYDAADSRANKEKADMLEALEAINEVWALEPEKFTAIVPNETRFLLERAIAKAKDGAA